MKTLVHFVHGKESGPWGIKITYLADIASANDCDVESLDYSGMDNPRDRADELVAVCASEHRPLILVGSSMGGWVVTAASNHVGPLGLFLLAPAFYVPGYPDVAPVYPPTHIEIVHGWRDEVIPYAHSVQFGLQHACAVHLVDDDHRLGGSLEMIGGYFKVFLERVT